MFTFRAKPVPSLTTTSFSQSPGSDARHAASASLTSSSIGQCGTTRLSRGLTASPALEVAHPLPVGDDLVEERLLGARVVQVVVDDEVAERGARDRPVLERGDRLPHR